MCVCFVLQFGGFRFGLVSCLLFVWFVWDCGLIVCWFLCSFVVCLFTGCLRWVGGLLLLCLFGGSVDDCLVCGILWLLCCVTCCLQFASLWCFLSV